MRKTAIGTPQGPFLRWAGSKRQLIPELSKYWNCKYTRYVEPFAGSASLFFSISPPSALLGDINKDLIETYVQVKDDFRSIGAALQTMKQSRQYYLRLRSTHPSKLSPVMRAARFIYLNRFCFNGLYRTNRAGEFNVPYSGCKTGNLPTIDTLERWSICLQVAEFEAGSFEKTLERVEPTDFVYMDPPFSVRARRIFNEYDASIFSHEQLKKLRKWMLKLDRMGISFLVSYADSDEGEILRQGFHTRTVVVRRNIAGFATNRRRASEFLISNVRPVT